MRNEYYWKNKSNLNITDARKKFNNWMNKIYTFQSYEFKYNNSKIIVEELLEIENNELYYYKVFCFNCKSNSIGFFSN